MPSYDLSQPITDGMPVYPGDRPVETDQVATVAADGYRQTALHIDTHTGTHLDAPAHMIESARSIDEFPIETFQFAAQRVDCTGFGPRAEIGRNRLADGFEDSSDCLDMLVIQTNWDSHWKTEHYFDHPFVTTAAAEWVVEQELHLAIDTPNVDPTPTDQQTDEEPDGYPAHHCLLRNNCLLLENLRGLERLPVRFELQAYPLAIANGDGAPVRAVAVVDA